MRKVPSRAEEAVYKACQWLELGTFDYVSVSKHLVFLPHDAMHKHGHAVMRCLSVCMCPFVTFVDSVKTNKHGVAKPFYFIFA